MSEWLSGSTDATADSGSFAVAGEATTPSSSVQTGPARVLRYALSFLIALALIVTLGAGAAASAGANGDLVVTKGGDRSSDNTAEGGTTYAAPVAGALFEWTRDNTIPQTGWTDFSAVTGANGRVTENLPNGVYYVREKTAAPGFTDYGAVQSLNWSGAQPYVARVRVENGETTYAYPQSNGSSNPNNWTPFNNGSNSNDGSPFLNVRDNGTVPPVCGTNILLVLDRSGSINPYRDTYRAAAQSFVDQFDGTPTQIGILSFSAGVNSYSPAQGDSDFYNSPLDLATPGNAATLNGTINDIYSSPGGNTNWDGALNAAAQAKGFTADGNTGQTVNPDLVVLITDGNPTTDDVTDTSASLIELTSGIASANKVKSQPSRPGQKLKMLAIGVENPGGGAGITPENLSAVSGPVEGITGDYATPTLAELQATLAQFAAIECGAQVFVRKRLAGDNSNQPDWYYTAVDPRPGKTPTYLDGNRATHPSGNPPVTETGAFFSTLPATPTTVSINEDAAGQPVPAGTFDLTDVDCRYDAYDGNVPIQGGAQSGLDYSLPVSRGDEVYCTYTNAPKTTLEVTKTPNNHTINAGDDAEFTIAVENTGSNTAVNAALSDQLPAPGATPWTVSQQPAGGTCSVNGSNLLTCDFGDIAAGATKTLRVKTTTSYARCGVYDNPAAAATADNAGDTGDGGRITCQKPDLTVDKTPNAQNINAGEDVVFTIRVDNAGPGTARGVTLSDNLPGGTAGNWVEDPANPDCSIAAGVLSCDFGNMASGASRSVTVKAPTDFDNCATYDNTATAGSSNAPNVSDDGQVTCVKPDPRAKLEITKIADNPVVQSGENVTFTLTVKNHGPAPSENVVVSDAVPEGLTVNSADNPCTVNVQLVECVAGTLAAGETRTYRIYTTADPVVPVESPDDQLDISKVEQQITLQAGETTVARITCGPGGIMSDASVRTDHVDQGTGDLDSVEVHRLHSINESSYETEVTNHATGQAQVKLFAVCIGKKTTRGDDLSVGSLISETFQLDQGTHTVDLACGPGTTPIAPGFDVSGSRSWLLASAPDGANGRKFTLKIDQDGAIATVSMRCISNLTSGGGRLEFTPISKQIVVEPGAVVSEQLTCPVGYKGVVAGWEYEDGLIPLGNDPQPITRVFKIWNPTGSPLDATLHLLCLRLRTGSGTPPAVFVNTAYVTSSTPQEPGAVLSDEATVTVVGSPPPPPANAQPPANAPAGPAGPTIYGASLSGRALLLKLNTGGATGKVAVKSPKKFRLGKKRVRKNRALGRGSFSGRSGKSRIRVRLNRIGIRAIRSGKLRRVRVTVKTTAGKKTAVIRARR